MRPHPALRLVVAVLAAMSVSSCGGADNDGDRAKATAQPASPIPSEQSAEPSGSTGVRITLGGTEITARLHDNATARDLAAQLPLTLTFRDHNNVEKGASLPRELSLDGAPAGHDPAAGDISYWAPDGNLVLYYDDAPYWNGIVPIGELDSNFAPVKRLPEGARVTIEPAG